MAIVSSYTIDLIERVQSVGQQVKEKLLQSGEEEEYHLSKGGLIKFKNRIYVPNNDEVKNC